LDQCPEIFVPPHSRFERISYVRAPDETTASAVPLRKCFDAICIVILMWNTFKFVLSINSVEV